MHSRLNPDRSGDKVLGGLNPTRKKRLKENRNKNPLGGPGKRAGNNGGNILLL